MHTQELVVENATLSLTTVHNHRLFKQCSTVVFTSPRRITISLHNGDSLCVGVKFEQLIRALPYLSFPAVHETAPKRVQFVLEGNSRV